MVKNRRELGGTTRVTKKDIEELYTPMRKVIEEMEAIKYLKIADSEVDSIISRLEEIVREEVDTERKMSELYDILRKISLITNMLEEEAHMFKKIMEVRKADLLKIRNFLGALESRR